MAKAPAPKAKKVKSRTARSKRGAAVRDDVSLDDAKAVIAAEMPGWTIVEDVDDVSVETSIDMGEAMAKSDKNPTIAELRRKFLGADAATARAADNGKPYGAADASVRTVKIKPQKGGSAKTADIKDGKLTIVQG